MIRHCLYTYRKDRIHEIVFLKSSHDAVDEWLHYLDLVSMYKEDAPTLLLDFSQSGLPPVSYFITRLREWQQTNSDAALGHYAVIYEGNGMMLGLLRQITHILGSAISRRTKFFRSHDRDRAVQWLHYHKHDVAAT